MYEILAQAAVLIGCGVVWRALRPFGLEFEAVRNGLSTLVYNLLLPALVLKVLWHAPLGLDVLRVSFVAVSGIVAAMGVAWLWYRRTEPQIGRPAIGALLLAASFGNVTYLGLPILEGTFGLWSRRVALVYDLFASLPLLLTLGVAVAHVYGGVRRTEHALVSLAKVPALWAAAVALTFNGLQVPLTGWWEKLLEMLAFGVIPLMLIVIGLSLEWRRGWAARVWVILPALVVQMVFMPLWVWGMGIAAGLRGEWLAAVVVEGAMPSMVFGIVLCERYRLDTALYAEAITLSTGLSVLSLPFWFWVVT